jgi:hypothetical protein
VKNGHSESLLPREGYSVCFTSTEGDIALAGEDMKNVILKANDVKIMAQMAVLVIPVLTLSYLVADTDKFKVSTLLNSTIVKRYRPVGAHCRAA